MATSISSNCDKALKKSLVHLKQLVKMDTLMPELDKHHILISRDHQKFNDMETSNDDKIAYLVEVLPQRSNAWWDLLLASLKATDDNHLKLAARILEIEKHSIDQSDNNQCYGDDGVEGNSYELLAKFMASLEVQKEKMSKEKDKIIEEKDKIIEAQRRELSQKQKVITKQEKTVANLKTKNLKVTETHTNTAIKQRHIRLIACSKKILNAGANVAETSLRYYYAILMVTCDTEDRHEQKAITYESSTQGKSVTEVVDAGSIRMVDHESVTASEKEWEKEVADKFLTELEEALETDNYAAMKMQQSKYALPTSDLSSVDRLLACIRSIKSDAESTYSKICIPSEAKQENVEYLIEIIVRFAVALDSFHDAIHSMCEEEFDLSDMILLSLKHPVYVMLYKLLKVFIDALDRVAQLIQRACTIQ